MRLIDADVLKYVKFNGVTDWTPTEENSYRRGWNGAIDAIMRNAPTVEAKRGHWVCVGRGWAGEGIYKCSICGHHTPDDGNYCSCCGAKMIGESDE